MSLKGPRYAYFEFDGFTEFRCHSPKRFKNRLSKGATDCTVGNRLIAGIVVCGNINTKFLYSMDELVRGGANCMIEVMRQALKDLSELLGSRNYAMPRELFMQFDNCGENKNK